MESRLNVSPFVVLRIGVVKTKCERSVAVTDEGAAVRFDADNVQALTSRR